MQERRFFHILECFLLWDELCICQCNVNNLHKHLAGRKRMTPFLFVDIQGPLISIDIGLLIRVVAIGEIIAQTARITLIEIVKSISGMEKLLS